MNMATHIDKDRLRALQAVRRAEPERFVSRRREASNVAYHKPGMARRFVRLMTMRGEP